MKINITENLEGKKENKSQKGFSDGHRALKARFRCTLQESGVTPRARGDENVIGLLFLGGSLARLKDNSKRSSKGYAELWENRRRCRFE